jgi:hypothetical protein
MAHLPPLTLAHMLRLYPDSGHMRRASHILKQCAPGIEALSVA